MASGSSTPSAIQAPGRMTAGRGAAAHGDRHERARRRQRQAARHRRAVRGDARAARRLLPARRREPRRRRSKWAHKCPARQVRHDRAAPGPGVRAGLTAPARSPAADAVARCFRAEFGRAVAILARGLGGDVDRAEEAVQDAYAVALDRWPRDGIPSARRRGSSRPPSAARSTGCGARRRCARSRRCSRASSRRRCATCRGEDAAMIPDERLGLVFACCHPALALEAQVPLTLRLVGGLPCPRSRARCCCPRRRSRSGSCARRRRSGCRASRSPSRRPTRWRTASPPCSRCSTSCSTRATRRRRATRCMRDDLAGEAIRLARVVHVLLPDEPEPAACSR